MWALLASDASALALPKIGRKERGPKPLIHHLSLNQPEHPSIKDRVLALVFQAKLYSFATLASGNSTRIFDKPSTVERKAALVVGKKNH